MLLLLLFLFVFGLFVVVFNDKVCRVQKFPQIAAAAAASAVDGNDDNGYDDNEKYDYAAAAILSH